MNRLLQIIVRWPGHTFVAGVTACAAVCLFILATAGDAESEAETAAASEAEWPTEPMTLEFLPVHPDSDRLMAEATVDEAGVPVLPATAAWEDYMVLPYDANGAKGTLYIVVMRPEAAQRQGIYLSGADVAHAEADVVRRGYLNICLNDAGAARMKCLTGSLQLGSDRLAMVLNKRIRCAPIVQAPLSREFCVSSLTAGEAAEIARALNARR